MSQIHMVVRSLLGSVAVWLILVPVLAQGNVDLPRYPSISPDGSEIVFSWRGDLWKVSSDGGHALRLTVHPAEEGRSAWSRDGSRIAFESDRNGYQNLYIMNADGTNVRQVTDIDATLSLIGFGVDTDGHEVLTLAAFLEGDVYRGPRPYQVRTDESQVLRLHDAFGTEPAISPDGTHIAFTRGGSSWSRRHYRGPDARNVWIFNRETAVFKQVTDWDGNDGMAKWDSSDSLVFLSDREDNAVNLYRVSNPLAEQAGITRLTDFNELDVWDFDVSADGSIAVLVVWDTLYTLDLRNTDAEPRALMISAVEDESDNFQLLNVSRRVSEAALSPDGKVMAVIAYGEVFVRHVDDGSPTRRITHTHAKEHGLAWSLDGSRLYFVSDLDGTDSIYAATVATTRDEVRDSFREATGIELDPLAADTEPAEVRDERQEDPEEPAVEADPVSGTWKGNALIFDEEIEFIMHLALGDDGTVSGSLEAPGFNGPITGTFDAEAKALSLTLTAEIGTIVQFELKVVNGSLEGEATADDIVVPISAQRAEAPEPEVAEPDEPAVETPAEKKLDPARWHDAWTFEIHPVVVTAHNDRDPRPTPDGRHLSFRRSRGDVVLLDLESGEERTIIEGWDSRIDWRFSPDGTRIAYAQNDNDFNSDIWVMNVDGDSEPVNISQHPVNEYMPRWSGDGRILTFTSQRIGREYDVWSVYLDRTIDELNDRDLDDYYKRRGDAAKRIKPLPVTDDAEARAKNLPPRPRLHLDDAYLRLRRITTLSGSEWNLELTPAGDRYIFTGTDGGSAGLFSIDHRGRDLRRLTGSASVQHLTVTGDRVVFVSGGRAGTVGVTGGSVNYIDISASIRIDLQEQASQKFIEAARIIGEVFYHPTMKDLDWDALTERYHALARQTRTADEFNYIASYLLGELNGSHLGVRAPSLYSTQRETLGHIGVDYEVVDDGFRVTAIIPDSPADRGAMRLHVGDVITGVNFEPVDVKQMLPTHLKGLSGEEIAFDIRRTDGNGGTIDVQVILVPTSSGAIRNLKYDAWQRDNRAKVEEWSGGRVGYLHIRGMNTPALYEFERDLFAAGHGKEALIVDVRNNGGGSTADLVLASIMVRPHAYTVPRGADPDYTHGYPQDRLYIQRYTRPVNMLCNEKSFSNAEIVSHAFKTLGRGTLVGQQTYGGVISTGGASLIDGTTVRTPFRGWYLPDGTDMENNGAVPNIIVPQTPEDESREFDAQLKAAVDDLLKRLE